MKNLFSFAVGFGGFIGIYCILFRLAGKGKTR